MTRIVLIVLCSAVRYAVLPVSILMLSGMMRPATAEGPWTLTIYVEEGSPNGHVFVGISDGIQTEKWGWYTTGTTAPQKLRGLIGCAGGSLKRDDKTPYNVSKAYQITRHAYFVIKTRVIARQAGGEFGTASWSPFKHCGHFALDVAQAASIDIPLKSPTPGALARYLRANGGVEFSRTCTRSPQPTLTEQGSALSLAFHNPTYTLKYEDPGTRATNIIQWIIPPEKITPDKQITLVSSSTHAAGAPIYAQWETSGRWANAADAEQVQQTTKENTLTYTGGPIKLFVKKRGGGSESRFTMQWNYTCQ